MSPKLRNSNSYTILKILKEAGQNFKRLAMLDELKTKPFSAVWDYNCLQAGVPVGMDYITEILCHVYPVNFL